MKIVYCLEYYYPHIGGVELVFQRLAEGMAEKGHDVTVVTMRWRGTKSRETYNGVRIRRVWVPPFFERCWFFVFAVIPMIRAAKHADIVHATTYAGTFPAWVAAKIRSVRSVLTVHEVIGKTWAKVKLSAYSRFLYQLLERVALVWRFDHYIAVSFSTQNALSAYGIPTNKITTVYNGVDEISRTKGSREMLSIPEKAFVFLYYGRSGMTKGVEVLIRSFHIVAAKYPDTVLVLTLSTHPRRRFMFLKSMILSSPAREHIIVVDPVLRGRLGEILGTADCVVVPSLAEGFGFTAAEASVAGVPLVASRAGSLPEVVSGNVVWVNPGDERALADGMIAAREGRYESVPVKRFSWEDMCSSVEQLYSRGSN